MAAPSTTNEVTVRRLSSIITGIWDKCKNMFQGKLPTSGTVSGTYSINISGNSATSTNATNHISNTSNPHSVTKSQVGLGNVTNDSQVKRSEMGTANGVATLDANGIINTSQLPSYVDDVLEYTAKSSFPTTGETGKIYVDTSTNLTWRWSGTQYVEISPSLALGETSSTAYRGDRGKTAYDHTSLTNNPHSVTKSQVGLGSVVNTGDSATPVSGGTTKFTTGGAYTELAKKVDKVSGKGLSTNDFTNTYKSNVDSNTNARHTHSNKSVLDVISSNNLVYDCGTCSTSTTDFDNALAAFNAGKWVIIHDSGNLPYYCVGSYSGPGLRFKVLASETSLLKVYTLNWTRGSAPAAATQIEASLVGHTHTNYVPTSRTINGAALTDNLSAADIGLPSTWSPISGPTYGIALDEGGIDASLKNISASTGSMTTDTYFLVHDAIGESSRWYARKINKLWDWVQDKIAAVLRLYTRNNDSPYFDGLAANAVQATKATNADITRTADTTNGDKLQIGTGTAVNITNAAHAKYADDASSAGEATYATSSGKAYEDGNGTTLAPLVVQYQTGTFPDIFNQLEAAYSSKRRIFCKHGLTISGSTDTVELKIPLSAVRFSSSRSIRTFEFATQLTERTSSTDNAGQTITISANHLENGSYSWGIAFDWPYHADTADVAGSSGTADTAKNYDTSTGTIKTALDGKAPVSHNHSASDITSGTFGASMLDIGIVRKSGDYFVPRMPFLWANDDVNLMTSTDSIATAVRANGYSTPITVYNHASGEITVSGLYPNKNGTEKIPSHKTRMFTYYNSTQGFFAAY